MTALGSPLRHLGLALMGLTLAASPAGARGKKPVAPPPPPPVAVPALPSGAAVVRFYEARARAPIWLKGGISSAAAQQLLSILKRAPLDGLAEGPQLAAQAQAALTRAQAIPAAAVDTEVLLSAIWVQYVQKLRAPVAGVIYGDKYLSPKAAPPEQILTQLAQAPSLEQHVSAVSIINPIYSQLRDAAWTQAQAGGVGSLDPRVRATLDRARLFPSKGRYMVADIATARLLLFEDANMVDSMKIIVGKRAYQTPMMASIMHYATLNPYWNIPTDVVKRSVAPLIVKRGTGYLKEARFEVASDWTDQATVVPPEDVDWKAVAAGDKEVRIRQLPGKGNMMGAIKFPFPNDLGIYLHDTPLKHLFAKERRTLSLGCVRVEDAKRLSLWLFGREPKAESTEPEQHVQLPTPVPIYLTYLTAHADGGQLTFADDVYGIDPKPETQLATAPVPATKLATAPAEPGGDAVKSAAQ